MFKTILQLGMLAAVAGMAKSSYDNGAFSGINFQPVISAIQKVSGMVQGSGLPGSQDAATGANMAIDAIKNLSIAKDPSSTPEISQQAAGTSAKDIPKNAVPHAFYKSTPEKCSGELTIDMQSGVATCPGTQSGR